ncbi:MAG: helix-turn-helix domain-containing protein [Clostridiales bacterium]|nr:helix-turn-helix domain-containing protein [Clostridiales bacterium]
MEEIKRCMREVKRILDQTVGIMDPSGLVIACTEPDLEGTEDSSVRAVLMSEDLFVSTSEKTYYRMMSGDSAQYIAFIVGTEPSDRVHLELVAEWVRTALKDRNTDTERSSFIKNILLENELPGDIPLKAREFKIPYTLNRIVFIIRVSRADGPDCLDIIQNLYSDSKTMHTFAMDEETIVLVMEIEGDFDEFVSERSHTIRDNLNAESMSRVNIGIGMPAPELKDVAKSYREAVLALRVGSIFESDKCVMRYDKLGLGRLIYQLPPTLCNMFLDEVFAQGAYESLDSETLLTIAKFFENNLNGSETSRKLFVHRNTLVYRLDKVQKITGLDLRSFDDAVLFKLAAMVRTYLEKQEKNSRPSKSAW